MDTNTSVPVVLKLPTLGLPDAYIYPAFLFVLLTYLSIMFCSFLVLVTIACNKKLHKPMFILLFNLPISDMIGATAFFPHLILSIATQSRLISYPMCVTQTFLVHLYGAGNLLILSAMAYDRYIAICFPLRYNAIMSSHNLLRIMILIWFLCFSLIVVLIAMFERFEVCRTNIVDLYCNYPSLLKLACEDTSINNYYGIFTIVFIQGGSLSIILYTYAQILRICVMTNQSDARRKAIQTCGTHLCVFLILEINAFITLISHRIESASPSLRRALGVSVLIFPPLLDPIIYGLKTAELRQSIKMFFKRNVGTSEL